MIASDRITWELKGLRISAAVLMVALLGIGCTKTDIRPTAICYPATMVKGIVNGTNDQHETLIYNTDNKVVGKLIDTDNGYPAVVIYTYDSKGNAIKAFYTASQSISYTYDASNNLARQDKIDGGTVQDRTTYQYNSNGQLITTTQTGTSGGNSYTWITQFEYPDPVTKNPSGSDFNGYKVAFEYDNKPNPEKLMFPSIQSDNNITKSTWTLGVDHGTTTYAFQYNSNGYPTSKISTTVSTIGLSWDSEIISYTYDCK